MSETVGPGVILYPGDCMTRMREFEADSVDSCVTDPPYHLTSIVKRFGKTSIGDDTQTSARARNPKNDAYAGTSRGFMGKVWDGGEIAFEPETWAAVYRVLKPGGHLLAFGAPKNFGFMQYAISQAGFEIRDVICWLFGSGFPKSHNQPGGFGTALKPAYEPIIMARKPLVGTVAANVMAHGTGALNIDGCRVAVSESEPESYMRGERSITMRRSESNSVTLPAAVLTDSGKGRWPANVIHDGSEEVVEAFPAETVGGGKVNGGERPSGFGNVGAERGDPRPNGPTHFDSGSAARFFYSAKADFDDRLGSAHPTVKPLDLMQYLCRLVTPKGGLVLDPFAGTGTTGEAAFREGMRAILIEKETEYQEDIRRRMKLALSGPDERAREAMKAKLKDTPPDHGPLFSELWKRPYWNEDGTAPLTDDK